MTTNENGTRYEQYMPHERRLHTPYDYRHEGLFSRLVTPLIANSNNSILRTCYDFCERSMIRCLVYVDRLQNFYNYLWRNR